MQKGLRSARVGCWHPQVTGHPLSPSHFPAPPSPPATHTILLCNFLFPSFIDPGLHLRPFALAVASLWTSQEGCLIVTSELCPHHLACKVYPSGSISGPPACPPSHSPVWTTLRTDSCQALPWTPGGKEMAWTARLLPRAAGLEHSMP